jgi:hypothetical protein
MEVMTVEFPRPRTLAVRESAEFSAYTRRARQLLEGSGVFQHEKS